MNEVLFEKYILCAFEQSRSRGSGGIAIGDISFAADCVVGNMVGRFVVDDSHPVVCYAVGHRLHRQSAPLFPKSPRTFEFTRLFML